VTVILQAGGSFGGSFRTGAYGFIYDPSINNSRNRAAVRSWFER